MLCPYRRGCIGQTGVIHLFLEGMGPGKIQLACRRELIRKTRRAERSRNGGNDRQHGLGAQRLGREPGATSQRPLAGLVSGSERQGGLILEILRQQYVDIGTSYPPQTRH